MDPPASPASPPSSSAFPAGFPLLALLAVLCSWSVHGGFIAGPLLSGHTRALGLSISSLSCLSYIDHTEFSLFLVQTPFLNFELLCCPESLIGISHQTYLRPNS